MTPPQSAGRRSVPWDTIGRFTVLILAWLAVYGVLAVVEFYWPDVYEFVVDGLLGLGIWWLLLGRPR